MKNKILHIFFLLIAGTLPGFGQTVSPIVQPSTGGYLTNGNLQLQYTIGEPLNQTFKAGGYEFSLGFNQPQPDILVGTLATGPYCAGTQISIPFTPKDMLGGGTYIAQLSDSSGSFASPVVIGVDTVLGYDTIVATIPDNITGGFNYHIRIVPSALTGISGMSAPTNIRKIGAPNTIPAQTANSDSAVVFGFKNVTALYQGNQIEWALNSGFVSSQILMSPAGFNITVNPGASDSVWVRSRDSTSTCISSYVVTTVKTFSIPPPPQAITDSTDTVDCFGLSAPFVLTATYALPYVFTISTANSGSTADELEWATNSSFSSSTITTMAGNQTTTLSLTEGTTVWMRSKSSASGCISSRVLQIVVPSN